MKVSELFLAGYFFPKTKELTVMQSYIFSFLISFIIYFCRLMLMAEDIELNPVPNKNSHSFFF